MKKRSHTNNTNRMKKIMTENKNLLIILGISILCLIVGTLAIGFLKTFLIIFVFDFIACLVLLKKPKKRVSERRERGKKKHHILKWILLFIFILGILGLLAFFGFFLWIANNVEDFDPNKLYNTQTTVIYDNKGVIIGKLGTEKREIITFDEVPEVLVNAIVATEDSRFFQHNGFDLPRFIKATLGQLTGNSAAGGASTLTMQISKNNFTSKEDEGIEGIIRKFSDIYISIFQIEKNYTKQQILEFYMNDNYLGGGASGVEQACLTYFGKHAKDINLTEAALITGLFNSPSRLDPFVNPEGATERRNTVLYLMELHGYISKEEREIASSIPVENLLIEKKTDDNLYLAFIDTVAQEIQDRLNLNPYTVSMEVYTTMDSAKQEYISKIMSGETYNWKNSVVQAGITVLDTKTGAVLAIGGGRKTGNDVGTWNYAAGKDMKRQIGSTAKPLYDYGPAIQYNNWDTYHPFADEPWSYTNGPDVNNWDGQFQGFITMRTALAGSRNIPALKTFQSTPNSKIYEFVTRLGLHPEIENGLIHEAHAIGGYPGENTLTMAAAYAAFGNKGIYNEPYTYTKIVLRDTGEVIENKTKTEKAMDEDTAYMITSMLISTNPVAIGNYGKINNAQLAVKTGTTNYPKEIFEKYPNLSPTAINDLWVIGYDPQYTMAIWYGYDQLTQENINNHYYTDLNTDESAAHAKLFKAAGTGIFTGSERFVKPNNVKEVTVEVDSYPAQLPSEFTPKSLLVTELFKEGTEPTEVSNRFKKLEDPTNVTSSIEGSTLTLSWDAVDTPEAIDEEALKKYFKKIYKDPEDQQSYLQQRLDYNKKNLGELSYDVYVKDADGQLLLVGTTQETSMDYPISSTAEPITFVVKTSYTIFKDNMSSGAELTVELDGVANIITASLLGDEVMQLPIGNAFVDPGVYVTDNLIDVTASSTITTVIKNSKGNVVTSIDVDVIETYTITYTISYNDFKKVLVRTLKVLENSE